MSSQRRRDREDGFTLIELLVVITILTALAGISIPSFLSQRSRGYVATLRSDLRNAATANDAWAVDHNGSYVPAGAAGLLALGGEGFRASPDVTIVVVDDAMAADDGGFCLEGVHDSLGPAEALYLASSGPTAGRITATPCTAS